MMEDEELGEQVRRAAERAIADIPVQRPTPEFYARIGQPSHMPRRYAVYAVAAAAAVVAIVFGAVVLQNPDTAIVDTASPPATDPLVGAATSVPELVDPVAAQLAADTQVASELGLTIGVLVYDEDGSLAEDQADLTPVVLGGVLVGYTRPEDAHTPGATSYNVYGPDAITILGAVYQGTEFVPTEN